MRHTHGSIEVICGSMFSGKTDELIRRLIRATIAKQKVQVFKPAIDVRYAVEKVTSHAGADFDAIPVEKAADILKKFDARYDRGRHRRGAVHGRGRREGGAGTGRAWQARAGGRPGYGFSRASHSARCRS